MIIDTCQRFTEGRESRRPAGELINPRAFDVGFIADNREAIAFVRRHHYIKRASPAAHRFGLYLRGTLVGVALFGPPASMNAHRAVWGRTGLCTKRAVTFGRLVLTEDVAGNGESWFIARCFELLADRGVTAVESCADPWERTDEHGEVRFKGHLGIIYQATNGRHIGVTNPSTIHLLPDATVLSNRAQGKLTRGERGDDHPVTQLVEHGATAPADGEDVREWLCTWRDRLCRRMRHRGNYRYVWCLDRRRRREVLSHFPQLTYPKFHH